MPKHIAENRRLSGSILDENGNILLAADGSSRISLIGGSDIIRIRT